MEHREPCSSFCSNDITALATAMLKVQAGLQPALKDRDNPFTHSRYATLNSVMEACRETLLENGIWVTQYPVPVENHGTAAQLGLVTKLVHAESGQWQSSLLVMPLPKADPQGYGSALTYARRYALSALVGIVAEDDDDAEGALTGKAIKKEKASRQEKPPTGPQGGCRKAGAQSSGESSLQGQPPPASEQPHKPPSHAALSDLPRLDGIKYSTVTTQDNRLCIVAEGDTRAKKQLLQQAGFRWSEQRKMWWKYAEAA